MSRKTFMPLIFILLLWGSLSCQKRNTAQQPGKIVWDRDPCQHCGMVISDQRYAAQVVSPDGAIHLFDDIGCALNWLKEQPWKEQARIWANEVSTHQWQEAKEAAWSFDNPNTPMGYGFAVTKPGINTIPFAEVKRRIDTKQTYRAQQEPSKHQHSLKTMELNAKP
ncbi:nitrous oxide reductase accessory protein NosL [Deltaproteobacteria bacterium TL4]